MDYKDLRSIQETYNAMYTEGEKSPYSTNPGLAAGGERTRARGGETSVIQKKQDAQRDRANAAGARGPEMTGSAQMNNLKRSMPTNMRNSYEPEGEMTEDLAGMIDKATKAGQAGLEKMGVKINRTPKPTARPSVRTQDTMRQNKTSMEEVDVFDIVKGYLIGEGLTEEEALAKMVNMTEEEKAEIVEMNAGPSTPVKEYDGKIMPNYGAGRIGKVRPKQGKV